MIPDQKLRCTAPVVHPGGGGVNVSRAIANLGGKSHTLLAYRRRDRSKNWCASSAKRKALEPESLGIPYPTRQSTTVFDNATGLQYRFMMPGPDWTDGRLRHRPRRDPFCSGSSPGALVIPSGSLPPGMSEDFFLDIAPAGDRRAAVG